jgi:hypothetical protein
VKVKVRGGRFRRVTDEAGGSAHLTRQRLTVENWPVRVSPPKVSIATDAAVSAAWAVTTACHSPHLSGGFVGGTGSRGGHDMRAASRVRRGMSDENRFMTPDGSARTIVL